VLIKARAVNSVTLQGSY